MSSSDAGGDDRPPLLPTMAEDTEADRSLRAALTVLRDQAADAPLRRRIDDVLAGRASLRDLARSEDFSTMVTPLAQEGYERYDQELAEQAERDRQPPPEEAGLIG